MRATKANDVAAIAVIAIPLIAFFYATQILNGIPLADEWRWLRNLLVPYLNGQIDFFEFITGEYSFFGHTHFLTLLAIFINFKTSTLQMNHLAYWGLVYYFAGWALLIFAIHQRKEPGKSINWLGLLGITAPYFTLTTDFPWLLVVYEYFYYFFAILLLVIYDQYFTKKTNLSVVLIATFFASILLDSFGVVAILSGLFIVILSIRSEKNMLYVAPLILFTYGLAWTLLRTALGEGLSIASTSRWAVFQALLASPFDILQSLLITFSQPIADKAIIAHYFPQTYRSIQTVIGLIGFIFVSTVALTYWKASKTKQSRLPLLLMSFGFIAWALILLTRYLDFGIAVFDAQRFTRFFTLYYVGAGAALYLGSFTPIIRIIASVALALSFTTTAVFQYKNIENVSLYFESATSALIHHRPGDHAIDQYIGQCAKNYCDDTIEFLRKIQSPIVSKN